MALAQKLLSARAHVLDSAPVRAAMRPQRSRQLDAALTGGLPPAMVGPLRFLITGQLGQYDEQDVRRVEALRRSTASSDQVVDRLMVDGDISIRQLALTASVDQRFGTFLYLAAKAMSLRNILELGACVGIGTSYLAASGAERVVTGDGEPIRAAIAERNVQQINAQAEVIVGYFDETLPMMLERLPDGIDLAWIDGHHEKDPTLRYFDIIRPKLNQGALVVFDDIRWSADMEAAWAQLRGADGFSDTIDLKRVGLGIWTGAGVAPRQHDLTRLYSG